MTNIAQIDYMSIDTTGEAVSRSCGALFSNRDKLSCHLFQTEGNDAGHLLARAPAICAQIINNIGFDDTPLDAMGWTYTAGASATAIIFERTHGQITGMTLTDDMVTRIGCSRPADVYARMFDDPKGFIHALNGDDTRFKGRPAYRVVVPIPHHPAGYIAMKPTSDRFNGDASRVTVLADPEKLMQLWITQTLRETGLKTVEQLATAHAENARIMTGDDNSIPPFHSTREKSVAELDPLKGYPNDLPMVSFRPVGTLKGGGLSGIFAGVPRQHDELGITNGRHRMINLLKAGAPFIPLDMPNDEDTQAFRQRFEWRGAVAAPQALHSYTLEA